LKVVGGWINEPDEPYEVDLGGWGDQFVLCEFLEGFEAQNKFLGVFFGQNRFIKVHKVH
jgi:hypothetical protein